MRKMINSIRILKRIPKTWEEIPIETKKNLNIFEVSVFFERYLNSVFLKNLSVDAILFQEDLFKLYNKRYTEIFLKKAKKKGIFVISTSKISKINLLRYVDAIYIENTDDVKFAIENEKKLFISYKGLGTIVTPGEKNAQINDIFIENSINDKDFEVLYKKFDQIKKLKK